MNGRDPGMMRKTVRLFLLGALLMLSACNRDYTLEDAKKYNRKRLGVYWPVLVSETEEGGDTVWTFRERNRRGLEYHIVEDHYITGIDSASWEASRLYSDYDAAVLGFYLERYGKLQADEVKQDTDENGVRSRMKLRYVFHDREELKKAQQDVLAFVNYVQKKNNFFYSTKDTYELDTVFAFAGPFRYEAVRNLGSQDAGDIEMDFLSYVLAHYDEDQMSFYTPAEIRQDLESENARICLKKGDSWKKTDIVTLRGNTMLYPAALYHLLEEEGFTPEGTPDSYTVVGADGRIWGPFSPDEIVYFSVIRQILGCDVAGEWNLPGS